MFLIRLILVIPRNVKVTKSEITGEFKEDNETAFIRSTKVMKLCYIEPMEIEVS